MKISAQVRNAPGSHSVELTTGGNSHGIAIDPKPAGGGSRANGGELLFLALATCYCNDVYREAAKRGIRVTGVEVTVEGEFGAEGEPGSNISYDVKIDADAGETAIRELAVHTDTVAEIQNTLRRGAQVGLRSVSAVSRSADASSTN